MAVRGGGERWREGIRADGTVEDATFETHWLPVETMYLVDGEGAYLRVVLDGPGIFYEARIGLAQLEAAIAKARGQTNDTHPPNSISRGHDDGR